MKQDSCLLVCLQILLQEALLPALLCWEISFWQSRKALIGFAGPRVIEQTIGQKLPKGFQKAEFLLEHGFIDKIVERDDQRIVLADILKLHENKGQNSSTSKVAESHISDKSNGNTVWPKFIPSGSFTPWEHVQLARAKTRPTGKDYIEALFDDFIEFHGDRHCGDDAAVIGGVAFFHGHPVTVLAQEKRRRNEKKT